MLPSVFPRLATDSAGRVFPGVWKPLFLKFPSRDGLLFPGQSSLPTSFVSFFTFYIFSYLFSKTMVCFSGCLMSSASLQKLFCGVCSALKCSFEEFVREKVVFPSYSSTILGPYLLSFFFACMVSWVWLWEPIECSLPGSSVHGIFQARILEWVAISSSRKIYPLRHF